VAKRVEREGIEAWQRLKPEELLGAEASHYDKSTDTLDVWFDSGSTHDTVLRKREELKFPADLYLEGSDQHRGWFHSSLLVSCAINGRAPYDALLTHGFVVDGQGYKMSKSKGNVIAPQQVGDTLGAEILRLWVAATDYSGELSISNEILKRVVESYRRIRNTLRFLLANTATSIRASTRWRSPIGSRSTATLLRWQQDCRRRSLPSTSATSSISSRHGCRRSAPKISARSTSTF